MALYGQSLTLVHVNELSPKYQGVELLEDGSQEPPSNALVE